MKKTISVLVLLSMMLATVLAVIPVAAEETALVKDYDTAADGDILYTFNFNGDAVFQPAKLNASADEMEYIPSADGSAITIKAKEGAGDQTINLWGGEVEGLTASLDRVYSFGYKAKANSDGYSSSQAKNNSVGIGGWTVDLEASAPKFYNNYGNHSTASSDDISMRRSAISWGGNKSKYGDYVLWSTLEDYAIDSDGYVDMLLVFDGPAGMISAYVLDTAGAWALVEERAELKEEGNMGFACYAYYNVVNTTVKDVKVYKGDYTAYVSEDAAMATEDEIAGLKYYIDVAAALVAENYSETTWSRVASALEKANATYGAEVRTQVEVVSRTTALMNAISALEADMTALNELVSECRKIYKGDYTADSWTTFSTALEAAKANVSTNYDEVKAVYDALVAARDALVIAEADKTELGELLELAALLVEADFAAEDWAEYAEQVAAAQTVFDTEGVTPSAVKDAARDLERAIKAINGGELPEKPEDPTDAPTEAPTAAPTDAPTDAPTEAPTAAPTEPAEKGGCGGIIGASAVAVAVLLGAVALKKKED